MWSIKKKAAEKAKKKSRVRHIKKCVPVNLDFSEEQKTQINKMSSTKKERIYYWSHVLKIAQDLNLIEAGQTSKTLKAFLEAQSHQSLFTITPKRFKEVVKIIKTKGLQQFIDNYEKVGKSKENVTVILDDDLNFFKSLFVNDNYITTQTAWELTQQKAAAENRIEYYNYKFPTKAAFLYQIKKRCTADVIDYTRKGTDYWKRNHAMFISKTTSGMFPMQCLVGDCMDFDVFVKTPKTKIYNENRRKQEEFELVRPKLTAWMDYRTHKFVGWKVHLEPQNTDHILTTLEMAISRFGCPKTLIVDNGKTYSNKELGKNGKKRRAQARAVSGEGLPPSVLPAPDHPPLEYSASPNGESAQGIYESKYAGVEDYEEYSVAEYEDVHPNALKFSEEEQVRARGILVQLGINVKFCLPYNSDAKPIERMFGIIHQKFDKLFIGQYAGVNKLRVPQSTQDTLKLKNIEQVKTFEEFVGIAA